MRFPVPRLLSEIRHMLNCNRGNVAIIFAFAAIMLAIAIGMGIDMWRAYVVKSRLQDSVDTAALAIASTDRTQFTQAQLQARVQEYANKNYPTGTLGDKGTPVLSYGDTVNIINVSNTATVPTTFMRIIGVENLSVAVRGQAKAAWPNIDFYLLLDSSPSMAIAATQAGINTMVAATPTQGGGCAFGCHQTNPAADGLNNPGGPNQDNYALARSLNVALRIDLVRQAARDLMTTAQDVANRYDAHYRMAIYTFDVNFNTIQTLIADLSAAQLATANIEMLTVYKNNWLTSTNNNSDVDTDYDKAMSNINTVMPNPGHGTRSPGDTPKEILFFVTDGLQDQKVATCTSSATVSCVNITGGKRRQSVMDPGWCTTIKNRGIAIAVLYTEYLPLPTNAWYNTHIAKFQNQIGPTLEKCATPGLYTKVQTGGDISAALSQLFILAVNSVYLSK